MSIAFRARIQEKRRDYLRHRSGAGSSKKKVVSGRLYTTVWPLCASNKDSSDARPR